MANAPQDRSNTNAIFQHKMASHECDDRDIHQKYLAKGPWSGRGPRPRDPAYDIDHVRK
jgi:hypothetical protein